MRYTCSNTSFLSVLWVVLVTIFYTTAVKMLKALDLREHKCDLLVKVQDWEGKIYTAGLCLWWCLNHSIWSTQRQLGNIQWYLSHTSWLFCLKNRVGTKIIILLTTTLFGPWERSVIYKYALQRKAQGN